MNEMRANPMRADESRDRARRSFAATLRRVGLATAIAIAASSPAADAQEPAAPAKATEEKKRIVDREPFDRITLDAKNNDAVIEVLALDAASRKAPSTPDSSARIRVRLTKKPEQEYELAWSAIVKLQTFEEILLVEAKKLIAQKQFNDAFEYFDRLRRIAPKTPGLNEAIQNYLYLNGGHLFAQEQYSQALSVLEELYRLNPDFKTSSGTLADAISKLAKEIVSRYMAKAEYAQARQMLVRLRNQYGEKQQAMIDHWEGELARLASGKRDEAKGHMQAERFADALAAVKEMLLIWPNVAGGKALAKTLSEQYPMVVVGVGQTAVAFDTSRFEDWGARRTGRLVRRRLCEFVGRGPEGGLYESPLGTIETSDDSRQLTLLLDAAKMSSGATALSGYDVSQRLLAMARPGDDAYLPAWGALVAGVSVQNVNRVRIDFRRSHVLPQALLQTLSDFQSDESIREQGNGPYRVANPPPQGAKPGELHFFAQPGSPFATAQQPRQIVERRIDASDKAIEAIRRGDVDALDRVFPADIPRLRNDPALVVGRYTLPTMHMLTPNLEKPFLKNRTFRRALTYALDRQLIVQRELCGGAVIPGCVAISGPFPAGLGPNDPLAYAYDDRIAPRGYNPRLAMTLIRLAEKELTLAAQKRETEPPKLEPLVLAHPPDEIARVACDAIRQQLAVVGLQVTLKELTPQQLSERQPDCDLTYVELALWEPAVDAQRLLGVGGLLPETNAYVGLALRRLEGAGNWKEASVALKELHRIVYDDVTVIPLYQLVEHYAYRKWLQGVGDELVQLYQNVEQWRIGLRPFEE